MLLLAACIFLSTLSLRRATVTSSTVIVILYNFYPRSPCGERHGETMPSIGHISYFYPRSPCGERLDVNNPVAALTSISIHALLAESDCYSLRHSAQGRYFYPRSPCGERHQPVTMHTWRKVFLLHALLAESDCNLNVLLPKLFQISIHALLAESDLSILVI